MTNGSKLTFVRVRVPVYSVCGWQNGTDFGGIAGQRSWKAYSEVLNGYGTGIERVLNGVLNELPQKTGSRTSHHAMCGSCLPVFAQTSPVGKQEVAAMDCGMEGIRQQTIRLCS